LTAPPTIYSPPRDCGLDLVYLDTSLLVVNKPPGLLSVPGRGTDKTDSLASRVQNKFPDALSVHRLDMSTSGLLVFARGADMHRRLFPFVPRALGKEVLYRDGGGMRRVQRGRG